MSKNQSEADFTNRLKMLNSLAKISGRTYFIPGRNFNAYEIVDIGDGAIAVKQNKTTKKHQIEQLKQLFMKGYFYGPVNKKKYDRDSNYGDLKVKNAIVDFLFYFDRSLG